MGSVMGVGDKMFLPVFLLCEVLPLVSGHGNMVLPYTWHDKERVGLGGRVGCEIVELPDYQEDYIWPTIHGTHVCQQEWFTNNTFIPGEPTIPEDMLGEGGHDSNPWFAPGTAPVFSPCGTYGGNLHGCRNDRVEKFGDCCSETRCGGFALGSNAETFTYPEAAVTEWTRGSVEEVAWRVGPDHGGGYSYRLCRVPQEGTSRLTEECFQDTVLDFVGDKQWVIYKHEDFRTEIAAKRTREGTYPPGSQWTKNPLRSTQVDDEDLDVEHGHVIDYIEVPPSLEPGDYVLSFRWDCQQTSQIWNVCANIEIV